MLYILEQEGYFDKNDKEEEENEDDEPICPRSTE